MCQKYSLNNPFKVQRGIEKNALGLHRGLPSITEK